DLRRRRGEAPRRRRPAPRRGDPRPRPARGALRARPRRDSGGARRDAAAGRPRHHARRGQHLRARAARARRARRALVIGATARRALAARLGPRVRFDAPLARHLPIGVGGPADALAAPESVDELAALVALAAELELPLHVLGGGFNTLVLDEGVDGIVVRTHRLRALALEPDAESVSGTVSGTVPARATADADAPPAPVFVRAEAGVSHAQIVRLCTTRGLSGL